jgi:hypothetical protein
MLPERGMGDLISYHNDGKGCAVIGFKVKIT